MRYALWVMRYGLCVMGYALWVMRLTHTSTIYVVRLKHLSMKSCQWCVNDVIDDLLTPLISILAGIPPLGSRIHIIL